MKDAILILGAGGFVGTALTRHLVSIGVEVIAVGKGRRVAELGPTVHLDEHFLTPAQFRPWLSRCRTVVHLASASTPGRSAGKPLFELDHNLRTTLALLEAIQDEPRCGLLYLSSGGTLYGDADEGPVTEHHLIRPKSYYGAGKAAAEHFITAWTLQFNGAATILRPSNVYGPGQSAGQGFGIIPTAFSAAMRGTPLTIWGNGETVRDYLFVDDLIRLCEAVLLKPMHSGTQVLNAASGTGLSLNALLDQIEIVSDHPLVRNYQIQRAVDVSRIILDPSRAHRHYGWRAQTAIRDGLEKTWRWRTQEE